MKQKRSRDLFEKNRKRFGKKHVSPERKHTLPEGAFRKRFEGEKKERLTGGSHPSGSKFPTGLAGARRLRWSPVLNHGEAERSEGTKRFRVFFRVGGWWTWPSESTTSTATLSPADGGSGDGGELRWVLQTPN